MKYFEIVDQNVARKAKIKSGLVDQKMLRLEALDDLELFLER